MSEGSVQQESESTPVELAANGPPGRFGDYGGCYAPETLMAPLCDLDEAFRAASRDPSFLAELSEGLACWAGRPTPLTPARRLSAELGLSVYLKREDLAHTGAHKINNSLGQCLLARRMGKDRVVAETGAGQHGVATAAAAAWLGLRATIYMGEVDMARQALNVYRMGLMGAEVRAVTTGSRTLKDAINETMRDWVTNVQDTHYVLGSALGPHPFPTMVRELQRVIGDEARRQILAAEGRTPDLVVACVGGGSNAIGIFTAFLKDGQTALVGVEAGGKGTDLGEHASRFHGGSVGVLHGTYTLLLQDQHGQIAATHSVSAGLDYPAVGPEHVDLAARGRARYDVATDEQALAAFEQLCRLEGILPALESSHALAWLSANAPAHEGKLAIVNLSGRGDKDVELVREYRGALTGADPDPDPHAEGELP
ncbi:tryptophan synthase subunit beta [Planctomycetota bacterium]